MGRRPLPECVHAAAIQIAAAPWLKGLSGVGGDVVGQILPEVGRLIRIHAWSTDPLAKQSASGQGAIANRLGGKADARSRAIGITGDDQPYQVFDSPTAVHELDC